MCLTPLFPSLSSRKPKANKLPSISASSKKPSAGAIKLAKAVLRRDMHGRERKSTPSSDPLHYSSNTLPRPKTKQQGSKKGEADKNLRWVVDSREQLEYVASRRSELESRGTIAKRMYDRKMANNTTSISFDGFGENKIEYVSDMMRSYAGAEKMERRDPFQDLKRAKQVRADRAGLRGVDFYIRYFRT